MSVAAVAKKDFQDGMRSKLLWALMALFLLVVGGVATLLTDVPAEDVGTLELLAFFSGSAILAIIFLVPLTGLIVSIKSIVRERELGSIKILLSLPHTRGEVLLGKFIGRSGLLTIAILVGFVPAALLLGIQFGQWPVYEFVALTLVTIAFGVVFVAVGLGFSALVSTETRATVAAFLFFILFYSWQGLFNWVNGQLGEPITGDALQFVFRFDLMTVFLDSALALLSLRHSDIPSASTVAMETQAIPEDPSTIEYVSQPFYLQHWFAFVILAIWIAVPLAIGYWRFENRDL